MAAKSIVLLPATVKALARVEALGFIKVPQWIAFVMSDYDASDTMVLNEWHGQHIHRISMSTHRRNEELMTAIDTLMNSDYIRTLRQ